MAGINCTVVCMFLLNIVITRIGIVGSVNTHIFQKQDNDYTDLVLADSTDAVDALQCSMLCLNINCDGFAFCPTTAAWTTSKCFAFTYSNGMASTNMSEFSGCSFYTSNTRQAPTTSIPTTDSTTSSTTSGSTTSTTCINFTGGGCTCPNGATDSACNQYMIDCTDNRNEYGVLDGLLYIKPSSWTGSAFLVRCYKGYTLVQMRDDTPFCRSMSFNRSWAEYKDGFGDIANGCFWLGNDKISALSRSRPYILILDTIINSVMKSVISYYNFKMDTSATNYRLSYTGTPHCNPCASCDGLSGSSAATNVNNQQFYTHDRDLNGCAAKDGAGWWYNTGCSYGNLNGNWPSWPFLGNVYTLDLSVLYIQRST